MITLNEKVADITEEQKIAIGRSLVLAIRQAEEERIARIADEEQEAREPAA